MPAVLYGNPRSSKIEPNGNSDTTAAPVQQGSTAAVAGTKVSPSWETDETRALSWMNIFVCFGFLFSCVSGCIVVWCMCLCAVLWFFLLCVQSIRCCDSLLRWWYFFFLLVFLDYWDERFRLEVPGIVGWGFGETWGVSNRSVNVAGCSSYVFSRLLATKAYSRFFFFFNVLLFCPLAFWREVS